MARGEGEEGGGGGYKKAEIAKLKASPALYKKKIPEEKRVVREEAQVAWEEEKAQKAAEKEAQKIAHNTKTAIQTAQRVSARPHKLL